MRRWSFAGPASLALCVLLIGCGSDDESSIVGSSWQLADVGGVPASTAAIATLELAEGGIATGTAGCNSFNAPYETDGQSISFGLIASTKALCAPEELNVQETAYFAALGSAAGWSITDGNLSLTDTDGNALAGFEPFEPKLEGAWQVLSYNNGNEAVVSVAIGTEITLDFADDGTLSGNGGCNDYSGTYATEEGVVGSGPVTIEGLSATQQFCPTPEGVMDQEIQFLAALEAARTWQLAGATLELRDLDGALQVSAQPAG
jgi:heat shock protein HslJ